MSDYDIPIWPVLEHYGWELPVERSGWQKTKCGAHEDSVASATVNSDVNAVNCFACGFSGDTIKVVMQNEGLEFKDAVARASEIVEGSGRKVRTESGSRRGVPASKRHQQGSRRYQPPRSRHGRERSTRA